MGQEHHILLHLRGTSQTISLNSIKKCFSIVGFLLDLHVKYKKTGDFFTGKTFNEPYVITHDGNNIHAMFNVCRHHAAVVAKGEGQCRELTCEYHGWTYRLDGQLTKATRMKGIENFKAAKIKLPPILHNVWGPLVFLNVSGNAQNDKDLDIQEDLKDLAQKCEEIFEMSKMVFKTKKTYLLNCNWKVAVDNYLDGGYHVPFLHKGLGSQLDLDTYTTDIKKIYSTQFVDNSKKEGSSDVNGDFQERVGKQALYTYIFPNLMINLYGKILDINIVNPIAVDKTEIIYYYYTHQEANFDSNFWDKCLIASDRVQVEDTHICESVQLGLGSLSYDQGRYAPKVEHAAYHFHQLLHSHYNKLITAQ